MGLIMQGVVYGCGRVDELDFGSGVVREGRGMI